jgi:MFS family permease
MLVVFAFALARYPSFAIAALLSFLLGVSIAPIMIASNTIVHKVSANHMMGKIFSSLEIVMHLGFLSFMFISGLMAEKLPHQTILVSVGVIVALLGLANLLFNNKIQWLD